MNMHPINVTAATLISVLAQASIATAQEFDYTPLRKDPSPEHVGTIIDQVARDGPGAHYFSLAYCTQAPGVILPLDIRARNPVEITIILQWQYWDLERVDNEIRVTVSFDSQPERIVIPLSALTFFSDPTANLSVWLRPGSTSEERCPDAANSA